MATHSRNDARGAARLLAAVARDCLTDPQTAPSREVALNNVFRLLEAYRTNAFFGLEAPTRQDPRRGAETLTLLIPAERHVKDVRDALEQAMADAFAGKTKNEATEIIQKVLRAVAYPGAFEEPSPQDRTQTARFFESILLHLQPA